VKRIEGARSKIAVAALLAVAAIGGSTLALANIAKPSEGSDAIAGAWIGQAAQPGQDAYDVRLTFVSPRGGISRYPGDPICGGVLVGDRNGDHYEYDETISYGGPDGDDNGCMNGKLSLSVKGDKMKFDWTATNADGDQVTSSGELHRQGSRGR
jgi:hypothetical protein